MRVFGVPLWAVVLVACIVAPIVIRLWVQAEQQRARRRTDELLGGDARRARGAGEGGRSGDAAGRGSSASIHSESVPSLAARDTGSGTG